MKNTEKSFISGVLGTVLIASSTFLWRVQYITSSVILFIVALIAYGLVIVFYFKKDKKPMPDISWAPDPFGRGKY